MSMGTPLYFISKLKFPHEKYSVDKFEQKPIVTFNSEEFPLVFATQK